MTNGQPFVVAVKVTSPGTSYPIAIEYPFVNYSDGATAAAGQSYVSSDGASWTDLTTQYANTNVCLKAYVKAIVTPKLTLKLSGLTSGAVKLGKSVTAKGTVTPTSLAGSKVKLTVQQKKGGKWVKVKSAPRTIGATGAYSWKYKPAKTGAYRMQATIAETATQHGGHDEVAARSR